jgi:hypothetical protein
MIGNHRLLLVFAAVVGLGLVARAPEGTACSICRCGDVTFNALGAAGYTMPGYRLALDWEHFDKEEGDPADEMEAQIENRVTALGSYGFNERFMLTARVPYSVRELTETTAGEEPESIHTDGWSDPEIYGQLRLWASEFSGDVGQRTSLCLSAGVKTPWGQNDLQQQGVRVDEHAQPGTGSTDLLANLALLHVIDHESSLFVSGGYRYTGDNDHGYRYGSAALANLAYEHKLGGGFDAVLELNYRFAEKDEVDAQGTLDDNTGGSLLYVTPRLLAPLGGGVVVRAAVQIPVLRDLNGFQEEKAVANVGLTRLFSY